MPYVGERSWIVDTRTSCGIKAVLRRLRRKFVFTIETISGYVFAAGRAGQGSQRSFGRTHTEPPTSALPSKRDNGGRGYRMWRCLRDWIGGKPVFMPPQSTSESYEEMLAKAKPIRQILAERGVDIEQIRNNLPEYLEKLEVAGSPTIIHGSEVPVTGSVHFTLGRVAKSRKMDKQLRK